MVFMLMEIHTDDGDGNDDDQITLVRFISEEEEVKVRGNVMMRVACDGKAQST